MVEGLLAERAGVPELRHRPVQLAQGVQPHPRAHLLAQHRQRVVVVTTTAITTVTAIITTTTTTIDGNLRLAAHLLRQALILVRLQVIGEAALLLEVALTNRTLVLDLLSKTFGRSRRIWAHQLVSLR